MELYNFSNHEKIYLCGDIHGEFERLNRHIFSNSTTKEEEKRYYEKLNMQQILSGKKLKALRNTLNNAIIIVTGDCGFGFKPFEYYEDILKKMNKILEEINSHLFFIRGNHDDPSYYDGKKINYSNIVAVPDYSVIITANENILCVGGAISLDRSWRISQEEYISKHKHNTNQKLYWSEEKPIYNVDELDKIVASEININFVITHSVPEFITNANQNKNLLEWSESDPKLIEDINAEHKVFTSIYNFLIAHNMELKGWFYGHFRTYNITKSQDQITFIGLDDQMQFHNVYETFDGNDYAIPKKGIDLRLGNARPVQLHDNRMFGGVRLNNPLGGNFLNGVEDTEEEDDHPILERQIRANEIFERIRENHNFENYDMGQLEELREEVNANLDEVDLNF